LVFLIIILAILIGEYLLNLIVDTKNVRHLRTDLPEEFSGYYDRDKYRKSQEYLKENTRFGLITDSIATPVTIAFILFGGFNLIDQFARSFHLSTIPTGLIFAGVLMLASQIVATPFSIYSTFVIEEKYGFNKTTPKTFILDILKSWGLAIVIGGILFSVVLWFFKEAGLEDGELRAAIEEYAKNQDFKLKGVFTMDGSKRSTKSNAFFTGFGRFRRIVLFDTLIEKQTKDELVSVLAHEMGHYKKKHILKYKKKHILKSIVISIITTGLMFYILSIFINNRELFAAFQMQHTSIYASLFFFGFLYAPIDMILSVFGNILSRRHEYEADGYAVATYGKPQSMITALKKLSVDNLSNLTPHPLKVFLTYSHPPVLERIRAIGELQG